jgi:hypothetical protein
MTRTAGPDGAKTSALSIRLTPKMKFGLEVMSRMHHISVPEIVTRAIGDVFNSEHEGLSDWEGKDNLPRYLLPLLWDENPALRLAKLQFHTPNLMSAPEKKVWDAILKDPKLWSHPTLRTQPHLREDMLTQNWERLTLGTKLESKA